MWISGALYAKQGKDNSYEHVMRVGIGTNSATATVDIAGGGCIRDDQQLTVRTSRRLWRRH